MIHWFQNKNDIQKIYKNPVIIRNWKSVCVYVRIFICNSSIVERFIFCDTKVETQWTPSNSYRIQHQNHKNMHQWASPTNQIVVPHRRSRRWSEKHNQISGMGNCLISKVDSWCDVFFLDFLIGVFHHIIIIFYIHELWFVKLCQEKIWNAANNGSIVRRACSLLENIQIWCFTRISWAMRKKLYHLIKKFVARESRNG